MAGLSRPLPHAIGRDDLDHHRDSERRDSASLNYQTAAGPQTHHPKPGKTRAAIGPCRPQPTAACAAVSSPEACPTPALAQPHIVASKQEPGADGQSGCGKRSSDRKPATSQGSVREANIDSEVCVVAGCTSSDRSSGRRHASAQPRLGQFDQRAGFRWWLHAAGPSCVERDRRQPSFREQPHEPARFHVCAQRVVGRAQYPRTSHRQGSPGGRHRCAQTPS